MSMTRRAATLQRTFAAVLCAGALGAPAPGSGQTPEAAPVGAAQEMVVTLEQAVELAQRASPTLAQRLGTVRTAESAERVQLGSFLPSLSLSSSASLSSSERFDPDLGTSVSNASDSYSAGVSSSIDLFTAGRRGAQLRQARANTDVAEAAVVQQQFAVALQAKQTFFNVLRADELIHLSEARVVRAEQALDAAERRMAVGSGTRSDVLRAQLELNQARQAVLQAQSQRRTAAYALGAVVGVDGPVGAEADLPAGPTPLALSDAELVQLAIEQSPAVRTAEAGVHADEAGLRASRTQYFPTLRASGGYDWFNQTAALDGGRTSWSTRLSLSYPIFNGFGREDAVERANVQLSVSRIEVEAARRQARADLESVLTALRLAEQQIVLAQEAVNVASEDLRVVEERYRLGAAISIDLLQSQAALVQAENDLVAARYDYVVARAQIEALVGRQL
jgi:TolC family type I secretion outer membrane protein